MSTEGAGMADYKVHKNDWPGDATSAQKTLAVEFLNLLLKCAATASLQLGQGNFDDSGAFGVKAEQRFLGTGNHPFYRASLGSSVERAVYKYLEEVLCPDHGFDGLYRYKQWGSIAGSAYALEFTQQCTELPHSFKSSRPDIRLSLGQSTLGKYYEAIYDLTSLKQTDHVLKKGDNWLAKDGVTYIAEVLWLDDDIMNK